MVGSFCPLAPKTIGMKIIHTNQHDPIVLGERVRVRGRISLSPAPSPYPLPRTNGLQKTFDGIPNRRWFGGEGTNIMGSFIQSHFVANYDFLLSYFEILSRI